MWPDFCQVKYVPAELLCLLWGKHLDVNCPRRKVPLLDRVKEILSVMIWVLGCHLSSFLICKVFNALVCFDMDLNIVESPIGLGPLVGMARVPVHVSIRIRS